MQKKFHFRSFISFSLFLSVAWLLISGTILYIAPPGRIAHWQHWTFFGFDKNQWQAQHTIFSYFFILITIVHIFSLNWRNLWSYVKVKSSSGFRKKKEFFFASGFAFIVFVGTAYDIPPLANFFEFGDTIGKRWEERQKKGPIPYAENLTLDELALKYLNIKTEELIKILKAKGIAVKNKSQTLKEIASQNDISPADIYMFLTKQNP